MNASHVHTHIQAQFQAQAQALQSRPGFQLSAIVFLALLLQACVTVNIYFPAAAAEKAADRIIDEVWGKEANKEEVPAKPEPSSSLDTVSKTFAKLIHDGLNAMVAPAYAQQANINVSSPAIAKIKGRMKARHSKLKPHYASGAVGLTRDALVKAKKLGAVPLKSRNAVKKLIAAENGDRNALYKEIAKANGQPGWEKQIRDTFGRRWISKAAKGWWYQDASGKWKQR